MIGRVLSVLALVVAAALIAPPQPAQAQGGGRNLRCEKQTLAYEDITVLGPQGVTQLKLMYEATACTNTASGYVSTTLRWGLADGAGRRLVAPTWKAVAPFAPDALFVQGDDDRWSLMTLGRGSETRPVAGQVLGEIPRPKCDDGPAIRAAAVLSEPDAAGYSQLSIYAGGPTPSPALRVGGAGVTTPVVRIGEAIVATWSEEGRLRSRVVDLAGQTLSPVGGEIQAHLTWRIYGTGMPCSDPHTIDAMMVGPSLDEGDRVNHGPLLIPVGPDGSPVALPPGVAGLFPLGQAGQPLHETVDWGVVFPTATGFEFTLKRGTVAEALAEAPTAIRYRQLTWSDSGYIVVRTQDDLWQAFVNARLQPLGEPGADWETALASGQLEWQRGVEAVSARYAAETRAAAAEARTRWRGFLADGSACQYRPPGNLDLETYLMFAQACSHTFSYSDVAFAQTMGAPPQLVAQWRAGVDGAFAEQRRQQAETQANWPQTVTFEQAARAYGDRAVRQIQQDTENWLAERRRQYYEELERANRR